MQISRTRWLLVGFVTSLVIAATFWWSVWRRPSNYVKGSPPKLPPVATVGARPAGGGEARREAPAPQGTLTAAEKAARIEKIRRDYDDIRTKAAADYTAAGTAFPGGLNAFLQELALLERERRKDMLTVLTPQELEELEMRESHAGELVQRWLGDTAATEEQRRAVFRLQQDFDDEFGWSFDLSPQFLLMRERERQQLQAQIRNVLGDAVFGSWLRSEGSDYGAFSDFAAQHALPPSVPLALWQLRNDFVLKRLALANSTDVPPDQVRSAQSALARQTEIQARTLLGIAAMDPASSAVLNWIPRQ